MKPREYTTEECREMFLDHIRRLVDYWDTVTDGSHQTTRRKLEGLAFSILSMLDGCSCALPAWRILTDPHSEDNGYHQQEGENWWPEDCDITADTMLHEIFYTDARKAANRA